MIFALLLLLVLSPPALAADASRPDAGEHLAPAFSLPGPAGTVTLESLKGKVVYVDFWASWCAPCEASFPWMHAMHERYAAKGLAIVAIDLDKDRDAAEEFLRHHPAPFLVAFDPAGKTAESYGVEAMPSSYLIGPTGTVLHTTAGFDPRKADRVEALIKEALSP